MSEQAAREILLKIHNECKSREKCEGCPFILKTIKCCAYGIMPCYWVIEDIIEKGGKP